MTDITLEQRARSLFAMHLRCNDYPCMAEAIEEGRGGPEERAAIAAIIEAFGEEALRLSAGADWVLVPREPTVGMVQSAVDREVDEDENLYVGIYRAMLAAAPRHETGEVDRG